MTRVTIRAARRADADSIFGLIRDLAIHEKALAKLQLTSAKLRRLLFGKPKRISCLIAVAGGQPIGLALWFLAFSSLRGDWMIYLEDLIVVPQYRRQGIGRRLMARVAREAIRGRRVGMVWVTARSDRNAIAFYRSLSAKQHSGNTQFVLAGDALSNLAKAAT